MEDHPFKGFNILKNHEKYQETCSDPAKLADMVKGWRNLMGLTVKQAAPLLGLSWRTLEHVEQGNGFRYPLMLTNSMQHVDLTTREARRLKALDSPFSERDMDVFRRVARAKTRELVEGRKPEGK